MSGGVFNLDVLRTALDLINDNVTSGNGFFPHGKMPLPGLFLMDCGQLRFYCLQPKFLNAMRLSGYKNTGGPGRSDAIKSAIFGVRDILKCHPY